MRKKCSINEVFNLIFFKLVNSSLLLLILKLNYFQDMQHLKAKNILCQTQHTVSKKLLFTKINQYLNKILECEP